MDDQEFLACIERMLTWPRFQPDGEEDFLCYAIKQAVVALPEKATPPEINAYFARAGRAWERMQNEIAERRVGKFDPRRGHTSFCPIGFGSGRGNGLRTAFLKELQRDLRVKLGMPVA